MDDNIIILTGRFGSGHIMAAEAVKEEIRERYGDSVNIHTIDIVEYVFPFWKDTIYSKFNSLVFKTPNLYNKLNKLADGSTTNTFYIMALNKMRKLIKTYSPKVVVSVLPLSSQLTSCYKKAFKSDVPLYTFVTDVCCHSEWIADGTDAYMVGDKCLVKEFEKRGVDRNKIFVTGIPIRKRFKRQLKTADKDIKKVLILGGGLGLIPNCDKLLEEFREDRRVEITIITGYNENLKKELNFKYPWIRVIGFTDEIDKEIMNSDLVISKAGGITLFECIYSEKPMLVINPFLLQERKNAEYILDNAIGDVIYEDGLCGNKIKEMLFNKSLREDMILNMRSIKRELDENREIYGLHLKVC